MEQKRQYLYEYQNGKRVRNLGYITIEETMGRSAVHLYGQELDNIQGLLFQKENGNTYWAGWEPEWIEPEGDKMCPDEPLQQMESEDELVVDDYVLPSNVRYEKIKRQDLSRLPRKEWRIANNSFLLHGFYNYHHLLYIEEDGNIWIGVPGIYHEKEEVAANNFGFPEFRRVTDADLELKEDERNSFEDFGYWCRLIS